MKRVRGAMLAAFMLLTACGYHPAGKVNTVPERVHSIAIPGFANQTQSFRVEQLLTSSVVQEFHARTKYEILNSEDKGADATLRGTVISATASPLTYDSTTGRVATVLVTVRMKVALTDRDGKMLYENEGYQFHDQYEVSRDLNSFFIEDTPALERLSRDFARTLVANILEGF